MRALSLDMFHGKKFYVDAVNGNNSNSGTSWENAKKGIGSALSLVQPGRGDQIYLHSDQFYELQQNVTLKSGMALVGAGPNTFIVPKANDMTLIKLDDSYQFSPFGFGHVLIQNLRVFDTEEQGTNHSGITGIQLGSGANPIYRITVRDCGFDCMKIGLDIKPGSGPGGLIHLLNNEFCFSAEESALKIDLTGSMGLCFIEDNRFIDNKISIDLTNGLNGSPSSLPAGIVAHNMFYWVGSDSNNHVVQEAGSGEGFWYAENYWDDSTPPSQDGSYDDDTNGDGFFDGEGEDLPPDGVSAQQLQRRDHYALTNRAILISGKIASNKKMLSAT